jgi:hypothetical protein
MRTDNRSDDLNPTLPVPTPTQIRWIADELLNLIHATDHPDAVAIVIAARWALIDLAQELSQYDSP